MGKIRRCILILGLLLLPSWRVQAGDFQLWTELKYSHTFPDKKFTLRWAEENRFYNDASKYGLFNTTLGFDYRVLKWLRPGYLQRVQKELGDPTEIRFIPQLEFLVPLGPIQFEDRNRFELRLFTNGDFRFRYRNRVRFSHTFNTSPISFTPFVSNDIFIETERTNPVQNRFVVGNGFGFAKEHIIFELYYMLQSRREQNGPGWIQNQILGTSLGFKY